MELVHSEKEEGFLVLWEPSPEQFAAISSEGAESAGSDTETHWGSTWVWFPTETVRG